MSILGGIGGARPPLQCAGVSRAFHLERSAFHRYVVTSQDRVPNYQTTCNIPHPLTIMAHDRELTPQTVYPHPPPTYSTPVRPISVLTIINDSSQCTSGSSAMATGRMKDFLYKLTPHSSLLTPHSLLYKQACSWYISPIITSMKSTHKSVPFKHCVWLGYV